MKRDVKDAWIAALRSGKYEQGTGYLRINDGTSDSFCCLGVLCDLYVQENRGAWAEPWLGAYALDGRNNILPRSVQQWAGTHDEGGSYNKGFDENESTLWNDNDSGKTFEEIADIIEEVWEEL